MKLGRAVLGVALALAACGGDDDGGGADGGPGGDQDGGGAESSQCGGASPARAVVVAINGDTDFVKVVVFEDGVLGTEGPSFPVDNPRGVAMRADGREAAVAYGGFGDPMGVAFFSIEAGGAGAEALDPVDLGPGQTPYGITYASDDRVVMVTAGPDIGTIEAIDRDGDGFSAAGSTEIPDNWPLDVAARPGHDEVVMLRANLAEDDAADVMRLARDGDGWAVSGAVGQIGPPTIDLSVHGGGNIVYGSTSDPDDPVSVDNLDAAGVLHALSVDDGVAAGATRPLPGLSSFVAIDPHDRFLVLPTAIYEPDDETPTPIIRSYRMVTVLLAVDGEPVGSVDESAPFDGLLSYDLDVTRSGHLIHAMELYTGSVPAGEESPVLVWGQPSPGVWEECQRVHLGGAAELAVAP
ncbi:MAG TPA: hypothetical protein VMZ28_24740 [Kofleriaceae bacterium]|nr:hypothetical protein [Kofleriaceae bacterium]